MGRLAAAASLVLGVASCASPDPSTPAGVVPLACISVGADDCQAVAADAVRRMTGPGSVVAVTVESYPCDTGQCPAGFEERRELTIVVELANPPRIHQFGATTMFTGSLTIDAGLDATSVEVRPASPRAGSGSVPFSTGHCGLWSPIDVDGSLWDVVGQVDGASPAAVNDSAGRIVLAGADNARYESDSGFAVSLVRRDGSRSYRGCD